MTVAYLEMLTKCEKCGEHYSHAQFKKCPHKFRVRITQLMAEGKWKEAEKEAKKRYRYVKRT